MMDKYDIAANVAVADLDGFTGRMSAAQQRSIFGSYLFGKKRLTIDASGQGRVYGWYSVCFGTDTGYFDVTFAEIADYANSGTAPTFCR
jgi:hypothetical protein